MNVKMLVTASVDNPSQDYTYPDDQTALLHVIIRNKLPLLQVGLPLTLVPLISHPCVLTHQQ